MKVKGLRSKNTIVLHPSEGEPISISKDTNELLFLEVSDLLESGNLDELVKTYMDIKGKIEKYSSNLFTVDTQKGEMYLKGDDKAMPELMTEKLLELEASGEDFMPLIRFWKKLKKNPSEESIEQLYGFMVHNGIGLTEAGDIVVEKGVAARGGILVDKRTHKIDNSIGETVKMDRSKVDSNPKQTCSHGLHVGAPEHVRTHYSGIIVKCAVNPMDVVAVPTDYNNTKMRVCEYTVLGYSDEHTSHKPVFKLADFVILPSKSTLEQLKDSMPEPIVDESEEEYDESEYDFNVDEYGYHDNRYDYDEEEYEDEAKEPSDEYIKVATETLSAMTGKIILDFVEEETGVRMPYSDKSKKTLIIRGAELLAKHLETLDNE